MPIGPPLQAAEAQVVIHSRLPALVPVTNPTAQPPSYEVHQQTSVLHTGHLRLCSCKQAPTQRILLNSAYTILQHIFHASLTQLTAQH